MLKSYFRQSRRASSSGERYLQGFSGMFHRVSESAVRKLYPLPPCKHAPRYEPTCSINLYSQTSAIPLRFINRPILELVIVVHFMNNHLIHLSIFVFPARGAVSFSLKVCCSVQVCCRKRYCCRYRYHRSYYYHPFCQNRHTRIVPERTCRDYGCSTAFFVLKYGRNGVSCCPQVEV